MDYEIYNEEEEYDINNILKIIDRLNQEILRINKSINFIEDILLHLELRIEMFNYNKVLR